MELEVDPGEASAIALSMEIESSILIIDDLKARKLAKIMELRFSGTFGLILFAKKSGAIKSIKPIIEKIIATDFRFEKKLIDDVLKLAEE